MSSHALLGLTALGLALSWGMLVIVVPRYLTSFFRYRLWQLRDRIYDSMITGAIPDCLVVRIELGVIESAVTMSSTFTILRMILFSFFSVFSANPVEMESDLEEFERQKQIQSKEVQEKIAEYEKEFEKLCIFYALFGTPSGWIFLIVAIFIIFPILLVRSVLSKGIKVLRIDDLGLMKARILNFAISKLYVLFHNFFAYYAKLMRDNNSRLGNSGVKNRAIVVNEQLFS